MSMVVNNNLMAANTARNLNAHYGRLATSTQRLSSGLRINSAADDAAGLAIRELQRADIAALQQGARNANDAISMIQVADGALGIIDEKLIRMKELAEQAATGTYDSTQRLMIESEYQAMASEITRIANATDFNGIKLLDGTLDGEHDGSELTATGKMKIHFGTGNDSAEDYYYITIGECTAQAFGLGNASTWGDVQDRAVKAFQTSLEQQIKSIDNPQERANLLAQVGGMDEKTGKYTGLVGQYNDAISAATDPAKAYDLLTNDATFLQYAEKNFVGNSDLLNQFIEKGTSDPTLSEDAAKATLKEVLEKAVSEATYKKTYDDKERDITGANTGIGTTITAATVTDGDEAATAATDAYTKAMQDAGIWQAPTTTAQQDEAKAIGDAAKAAWGNTITDKDSLIKFVQDKAKAPLDGALAQAKTDASTEAQKAVLNANIDQTVDALTVLDDPEAAITTALAAITMPAGVTKPTDADINAAYQTAAEGANAENWFNGLRPTQQQKLLYAFGQAAVQMLSEGTDATVLGTDANLVLNGDNADILANALKAADAKVDHMDFAGHTIETQEDAQHALEAINEAIVQKDKIRAHLGATQNRLENTVSNLNIQAENLQAAESRISDVDVATEMTQFVRNQILTQSAVAMLSQANSLPQMAMQLIGG